MQNKKVELYEDQLQVIKRIEELKLERYKEDDMYIIVDDDEEISMLRGYTDIMIKEEDDSLFDRFRSFLKGRDSVTDAFNRMDLEEEHRDACYEEVQEGKILLMVNKDYESKFELTEDGIMVPKEDLDSISKDEFDHFEDNKDIEDNLGFKARKEKTVIGDFVVTDIDK